MTTITIKSHVGSDGIVQLQLPTDLKDQNVTITIQSDSEENWLSVLEQTAGSIPDLERPPQGADEVRQSFDLST